MSSESPHYDLAIVGAGIVGLGAALAGSQRGLRVVVLEQGPRMLGASVQNFGHIGVTLQQGLGAEYARRSRELWLEVCGQAGIWHRKTGAMLLARAEDELALLEETIAGVGRGGALMHTREQTTELLPIADPGLVGSATLRDDLQVDPRTAGPQLANYVKELGVTVRFNAHVQSVESGAVSLSDERILADRVLVSVNADIDRFFPKVAAATGVQRCMLDMIGLDWANEAPLPMPVLTASSLLRYSASESVAARTVRARLYGQNPQLREFDVNEMYTQRPDGMLIVGDTHRLGSASGPFQPESAFELLLSLVNTLFGVARPRVLERWQGVYAKTGEPFIFAEPLPGVGVASVTTGIGMTTGLGFAEHVVQHWR